jgi:micrococcal nuclease
MWRSSRKHAVRYGGRIVRLPERPRARRAAGDGIWRPWRKVGMIVILAAAVVGGREWAVAARGIISGDAQCSIGRVVDGDTLKVWCPRRGLFSARLRGLDTPEVFSPGCISEFVLGVRATWALRQRLWAAEDVQMVFGGVDRYDRRLMWLYLDGTNVASPMIADGLARAYAGGPRGSWCR